MFFFFEKPCFRGEKKVFFRKLGPITRILCERPRKFEISLGRHFSAAGGHFSGFWALFWVSAGFPARVWGFPAGIPARVPGISCGDSGDSRVFVCQTRVSGVFVGKTGFWALSGISGARDFSRAGIFFAELGFFSRVRIFLRVLDFFRGTEILVSLVSFLRLDFPAGILGWDFFNRVF